MQFVVIGLDKKDEDSQLRRQKSRSNHIKMGEELLMNGNLLYGAALLNEDGTMKGSIYILNFKSKKELYNWLEKEPYVVGEVWNEITIHISNTRDPWQFNRKKEWFEKYL